VVVYMRLPRTLPPIEPRLRARRPDRRNHGLLGHDSTDDGAPGEKLMSFQTRSKVLAEMKMTSTINTPPILGPTRFRILSKKLMTKARAEHHQKRQFIPVHPL